MRKDYPIDPQFKLLSNFELPPKQKWIYGIGHFFMRLLPATSNKKTRVRKIRIKGPEGNKIPVLIFEPKGKENEVLPVLFYTHGGGFMCPAVFYQFKLAKEYASRTGCRVIFPDYRLTPKHVYPAALDDCMAAYKWMLDNSAELKIDTDKIMIGGDSAGGDLAAAMTLKLRDEGIKAPMFQMLIYPVTDCRMQTESTKRFPDTPVWNSRGSIIMWDWYLPKLPEEHIEYASPLEAPSFENLPDAYVEVAEYDSLRDEGLAYAQKLKEAGAQVEIFETRGTPHGFEIMTKAPITQDAIQHRCDAMLRALG